MGEILISVVSDLQLVKGIVYTLCAVVLVNTVLLWFRR